MPELSQEPKPELSKLEERVRSLALEKSYLQLVNDLMCSLGEVHGLSSIDEAILRLILDNLGGDNVSMHYFVGTRIHYCDVYGIRRFPEQVEDPLVQTAIARKCLVEQLGDFSDTRMTTPAFTQSSTWAEPMMVGERLVGVLKCEGMLMSAAEMRERLRAFINYAALVLKNEIDGHLERMESAHLAAIVQSSEDAIIGKTLEGIITSWNRGAESIYGYSAREVIGRPIALLTDREHSEELSGILERLRQGQSIEHLETQRRRKDGCTIEVALTLSPIRNAQGLIVGASTIARDITRQKEDERRIKDSEQRMRLTLEAAQIGTWEWDVRSDRWVGSPIYHSMLGNQPPPQAQSSREWLQAVHPEDLPLVQEHIRDVIERNSSSCSFEVRMRHADGSHRWQNMVGFGVERDQESRVQRMLGVRMDVDVRKRAEEAQLRVNRELRAVSSCHQTLLRAEDEQTLLENICRIICTEAGYRMAWVGYAEHDETHSVRPMAWAGHDDGYVAQLHVSWADNPRGQGPSGTAVRTGEDTCCQDFRIDPKAALWRAEALQRGYLSNIALPLKDEDAHCFGALTIYSAEPAAFTPEEVRLLKQLAADLAFGITTLRGRREKKKSDAALRESELRFRQISETIEEAFWLADPQRTRMIYISPAFEKICGRSCASLQASANAWLETVHPDDRARIAGEFEAHAAQGYDIEYRIVRPDGTPRWIRDRAFPIRNPEGKVERLAGVAADVTDQRQLEVQFRHVQKMEAIGQFAGGIAHDFNNLLAAVQLQASLLLTEGGLSQELREGLQSILTVSESAAGLTRQILTFSRRNVPQKRELHLDEIVEGMIKLLRRVLGEDISLETRFAAALPIIHADPGMMEQILMNLAVNARDAMKESGRLSVTLDTTLVPANKAALHPQVQPGQFVVLCVSDTGCGMPPEVQTRIFEPFFTTKPVGKGTGLGLATVFGIVQQHGGFLEVESVVGKGTSFRIFLPALSATAQEQSEAAKARTIPGGKETLLLVEDNSVVRALARTTLEHYGYRVFEAASGRQALEVWERNSLSIDLLLTDLVMPGGMSGLELAEQLIALQPRLRVLYTSGYSHDVVGKSITLDRETNFLHKPFSIVELATLVRRCLDARRK